ncbi:MAG: adenine phosphoribosyltransferase [Clostridia bacterium]|nr:adenine phosphoribosyltransferase [Clostridia bacterium]
MDKFYKMTIAGLERELPICKLNDELSIAGFIMFGDVELTEACAKELLAKIPGDFDYIVTPEAKSIPLAYEMSRQSGKKYIVVRKKPKVYMQNPVSITVRSITTQSEQMLYLDGAEGELMRGKKIIIVDDVISTGESLSAVEQLVEKFDVITVAKTAVLAEGDAAHRPDLTVLGELPLIKN